MVNRWAALLIFHIFHEFEVFSLDRISNWMDIFKLYRHWTYKLCALGKSARTAQLLQHLTFQCVRASVRSSKKMYQSCYSSVCSLFSAIEEEYGMVRDKSDQFRSINLQLNVLLLRLQTETERKRGRGEDKSPIFDCNLCTNTRTGAHTPHTQIVNWPISVFWSCLACHKQCCEAAGALSNSIW